MVISKEKKEEIIGFLSEIQDPEIPVISIVELGVIRDVIEDDGNIIVKITPTYSGCPAMNLMEKQVLEKLEEKGYSNSSIERVFAPAWTTDWLNEEAKEKLRAYGIAPPLKATADKGFLSGKAKQTIRCPRCESESTTLQSLFGSTACKALYRCNDCHESFDYFKCI